MKLGDPIYVESLLGEAEYRLCSLLYAEKKDGGTYLSTKPPPMFKSEFMWRYRMGKNKTSEEIALINGRIDELLKKIK